jgi:8-oxo-dGTP diphosphatase
LEETNLELSDDLHFVSAENNFFIEGTPQRHYVTMCLAAHVVDEVALQNTEPDKCEGWEWVSAKELLDDNGRYRPLFVPLRHIFVTMGLV